MAVQDYATLAQTLYVTYFGRPGDYFGMQSFQKQLNDMKAPTDLATLSALTQADKAGTTALSKLVNSFSASPEATAMYGTDTSALGVSKFVEAIYLHVLNRAPDAAGWAFWVDAITSGALPRATAAAAIADGAVHNTSTQGLLDAKTVANKIAVATDFTNSLVTVAQINGYAGNDAAAAARDMLAGVDAKTVVADFHATVVATVDAVVAASIPSTTFNLTTGVDTIVGGAGNDIINATNNGATSTLTGLDTVDGGAGKDTLNISDVAGGVDLTLLASVKNVETAVVTSTGGLNGNAANVSGWTGLTSASFALKSGSIQTITAADTTAVTVSNTAGATIVGGSSINVTTSSAAAAIAKAAASAALTTAVGVAADTDAVGVLTAAAVAAGTTTAAQKSTIDTAAGTSVAAAATASGVISTADAVTVANYNVTATSNAALASATIKGGNTVTITDGSTKADQLKSVSLDGNQGLAKLTGDALVSVSLANSKAATTIINSTAHTETVTLNNVTGGLITDANATTFNVATTGTKSSGVSISAAAATTVAINAAVDAGLTDISANKATSIVVTGAGKTTIGGLSSAAALASIDATGNTGGVIVTPILAAGVAFAGGTGNDTIKLGASTKAITMGAGDDTVIISGALGTGGTVDAGAGTNDTLAGTSAVVAALTALQAGKFTNFETLKITDVLANNASFDVSAFAGVVNFTAANGVAAGTAHAVGLGANVNVTLSGDLLTNAGTLDLVLKTDTTADVLNVTVNHSYLDNNNTTADAVGVAVSITAAGIETLNVKSTATNTLAADTITGYKADVVTNTLTLGDDAIVTLNVTGDTALKFTAAATQLKLATIDASANTAGVTIDAHLIIDPTSAPLTIKGSATAANTLIGGQANDTIIGGSAADVITGGKGGDTLTGKGGNDTFIFAAGDSSIGTGKFDTITDFVANTYGNGASHAAGTGADLTDLTKVTGDILSFGKFGTGAGGVIVDVLTSAADASTYLANHAGTANTVIAALDSTNNNLYIDNTGDGVADFYIHLTGVTTINAAAFTLV